MASCARNGRELTAKANELEAAKRAEREARATVDDQNKRLRPLVDARCAL